MQKLKDQLKTTLKGAKRIAVLGIGSELRADDAAGVYLAKQIIPSRRVKIFIGGDAPENITGEIKKFRPTHLILLDAADFKKKPGFVCMLDPCQLGGVSFSTHRLPLNIFSDYIKSCFPCEVAIIAIQPKTVKFAKEFSPEVKSTLKKLSQVLKESL